jgi:hypothetical protein
MSKPSRPANRWSVSPHIGRQALAKGIPAEVIRALLTEAVEVWWEQRNHDRCRECGNAKVYLYAKEKPASGVDAKLVGCPTCSKFFTVYLHERSHGNTPIRPDQIAAGVTSYRTKACRNCGFVATVTTEHKTQAQVDAVTHHECRGRR